MAQAVSIAVERTSRKSRFDFMSARGAVNDAGQGFYESSFDLREGLDVIETSTPPLPDELEREFKRLAGR